MLKIDPETVYERKELEAAFPDMSQETLTKCMLEWGARRPFPTSRKLFILGSAILSALAPPRMAAPLPPADSDTADLQPHPHAPRSRGVRRRRVAEIA